MAFTLADCRTIALRDAFGEERLDRQGEEHWPRLDQLIREEPRDAVIALDLRGLLYVGYSYAKATIRRTLQRRAAGDYAERRLFLVADQGNLFLDGIEAALEQAGLFALVTDAPDAAVDRGRLIGAVPDYIRSTFDTLRRIAPVTTGALAREIDQSPQNTKNRLDRLYAMGLLRREKVPSPTGGLEWLNRVF